MKKRIYYYFALWLSIITTNFAMEEKEKEKITVKPETKQYHSVYYLDKTGSLSPDRFENDDLWRQQTNLHYAHRKKQEINFILTIQPKTRNERSLQFGLVKELYAKFEAYNTLASENGEPYNPKKTKKLKKIVEQLAHTLIFNEGIYFWEQAYKKLDAIEKEKGNPDAQTTMLQRAMQHAIKAKDCFLESLKISNTDQTTYEKLSDTQSLIMLLAKRLNWTPRYQQKVSKSEEAYKEQMAAKEKLAETKQAINFLQPQEKNFNALSQEKKQVVLMHYEEAEKSYIAAAQNYLLANDAFLNENDLENAQRILDEINKIEAKKLKLSLFMITHPEISEIADKIEQGFKQLKQQHKGSLIIEKK